jgi:hypothetical protein
MGSVMPTYRVFFFDAQHRITLPAKTIDAADDQEAIAKSRQYIDGRDIELWDGPRFIARFPHK